MPNSNEVLFNELARLINKFDNSVRDALLSNEELKHWIRKPNACDSFISLAERESIGNGIADYAREQLILFCDSIMAGLDGATKLTDSGQNFEIVDSTNTPICRSYQMEFMEFLIDIGLQ